MSLLDLPAIHGPSFRAKEKYLPGEEEETRSVTLTVLVLLRSQGMLTFFAVARFFPIIYFPGVVIFNSLVFL